MKTTYTSAGKCGNCGKTEDLNIPYGVTIIHFLQGRKCDNCGCAEFREYSKTPK